MSDSKNQTALIKSNTLYDIMKHITQITLPALGTLYFALSQIWGLPAGAEVVGSITAVDAFLGLTLGISSAQYNNSDAAYDGHINVTNDGTATLNLDPNAVADKDKVVVKVNKPA